MIKRTYIISVIFGFTALLAAGISMADGPDTSETKTVIKHTAEKDIRLTPDKTELIRLETDAASVIVTNPEHAVVQLESPRLLIIMPRQPGTTAFTVLDKSGKVIMEKSIIVTAAQPRYVRVRRVCGSQDASCVPSAYYYCPDGCYEVNPVPGDGSTPEAPVVQGAAPDLMQQGDVPAPQTISPPEKPLPPSEINKTDGDVSPEEEFVE